MADMTDVASSLVQLIANVVYPNGTASASIVNADVKIYQGWCNPQQLDVDLANSVAHITVYPKTDEKVSTVPMAYWDEVSNNGTTGTIMRQVRRESRSYQVSIWSNSFTQRDALASKIDAALSVVDRMQMPDGTQANMRYVNSAQLDEYQKQMIYRRDLFFNITHSVTVSQTAYTIKEVDVITEVKTGLQPL